MQADIVHIISNAEQILTNLLWPDGPTCPSCKSHKHYKTKDGRYLCKDCHRLYSIKTGTIFQNSKIPLSKWMIALYLTLVNNGISSYKLARHIQTSQPTAYYILLKLRFLFTQSDTILTNQIAVDEEYVGGSWAKMPLSKRQFLIKQYKLPQRPKTTKEKIAIANTVNARYKQPVLGMNDGKKLILRAIPNPVYREDVVTVFNKHSQLFGTSVSDCSKLYKDWSEDTGYTMTYNNHSKGQFVSEDGSSSNRIEGSFSQFKRNFLYNHCFTSKRLIQLYLDEFCFRWNNRHLSIADQMKQALLHCHQVITRSVLVNYNSLDEFPIRTADWFDPYEYFKELGYLIDKIEVGGVVYRREEFGSPCY